MLKYLATIRGCGLFLLRRSAVAYALIVGAGCLLACSASDPARDLKGSITLPDPVRASSTIVYLGDPYQPKTGEFILRETTTGSLFNLRGEAFEGPLASKKRKLEQIPGVNMYWFAWAVWFPGTAVWGLDRLVSEDLTPSAISATVIDKQRVDGCSGRGLDCIPSLPNTGPPRGELDWIEGSAATLEDDIFIIGIFIDGVARAYPRNSFWNHEIGNDHIGDRHLSVTLCPLTGSSVVFDGGVESASDKGSFDSFGVSGFLFNNNLIMYDHASKSLWPQLFMGPVSGPQAEGNDRWLKQLPFVEMTWKRWKELYPKTVVLADSEQYSYPYGAGENDYRNENNAFTLFDNSVVTDDAYPPKMFTYGLVDRSSDTYKAYPYQELKKKGKEVVVSDSFRGKPTVLVYEASSRAVIVFSAENNEDGTLEFEAANYEADLAKAP